MWLLEAAGRRRPEDDLGLGISTALVAGAVNVCGVMAFFAFSSNVTGHAATFAEELVKGHWYQVAVVAGWMLSFGIGAFFANAVVTLGAPRRPRLSHAVPLLVQAMLLATVAHYGQRHYQETLWETEVLVTALLFTMGLQNGMVSTVSNSAVRTTHLTGLLTELAMGASMVWQPAFRGDTRLRFRLRLQSAILVGYLLGGLLGGGLYAAFGFAAFYLGPMLLCLLLARDLASLWQAPARVTKEVASAARVERSL